MKLGERMDAVMALNLKGQSRKAVLFVLARRANDRTGKSWISLERLAYEAGTSTRTTTRAIKYLETLPIPIITVERDSRHTNRFKLDYRALRVAILARLGSHIGQQNPSFNRQRSKPRTKPPERLGGTCITCKCQFSTIIWGADNQPRCFKHHNQYLDQQAGTA